MRLSMMCGSIISRCAVSDLQGVRVPARARDAAARDRVDKKSAGCVHKPLAIRARGIFRGHCKVGVAELKTQIFFDILLYK